MSDKPTNLHKVPVYTMSTTAMQLYTKRLRDAAEYVLDVWNDANQPEENKVYVYGAFSEAINSLARFTNSTTTDLSAVEELVKDAERWRAHILENEKRNKDMKAAQEMGTEW